LKKVVLADLKASRMKGLFDVALVSLFEERLLERTGSGNWARYHVPQGVYSRAQAVAFYGWAGDECDVGEVMRESGAGKRELSLSPLRVSGARGMKKRKRRSVCSLGGQQPMSP